MFGLAAAARGCWHANTEHARYGVNERMYASLLCNADSNRSAPDVRYAIRNS
jgi:hypothetical protein